MRQLPFDHALRAMMMDAAQAHARRHAANFIGFDEFQDPNGTAGSGVFVDRGDGRVYVATAAHNIDDGRKAPTTFMKVLSEDGGCHWASKVLDERCRGGRKVGEEWDLAAIELPRIVLDRSRRQPLPFDRIDPSWKVSDGNLVMMYGLTEDRVERLPAELQPGERPHSETYREHSYFTVPAPTPQISAPVWPDMDLFLQYPKDKTAYGSGILQRPWSPKGMSGGGVWALNNRPGELWTPEAMRLVGIVIESNVEHDWVRAARISKWLEVLASLVEGEVGAPRKLP